MSTQVPGQAGDTPVPMTLEGVTPHPAEPMAEATLEARPGAGSAAPSRAAGEGGVASEAVDAGSAAAGVAPGLSVAPGPEAAAEGELLRLLNLERAGEGLEGLRLDLGLRDLARAHGMEMLELGYFSHESPVTGSLGDRLRVAGIRYSVAGENLALALDVQQAHQALMGSRAHRANALDPRFRRVGIAAVASGGRAIFVELFTD